jgi:hypothetical protein
MLRAESSRHDKGPDSVLPELRIVNEEGAEKVCKLMVPEGQQNWIHQFWTYDELTVN